MGIDKESIRIALTRVPHPNLGVDVVTGGAIAKIAYCDGYASLTIAGGGLHDDQKRGLMQQASAAVRLHAQQAGVELADVHVEVTDQRPMGAPAQTSVSGGAGGGAGGGGAGGGGGGHRPIPLPPTQSSVQGLPNVKHIIAVGAGKGGVGKSTIAVNLAVGLARKGHAVGLMDGDIYGPSLPTMLGLASHEAIVKGGMIQPFFVQGVKAMTIGKLVDAEKPLIWRGPMAHGAFKQLVEQTEWGELDYLIIDLPPGTGDVSLTMAQLLKLTGAVVVCTPQKVAQDDAVRAARMFQQLQIEVLGVVENMSSFVAEDFPREHGGPREYDIFGKGGAQTMAQRLGLPFLGAVPITMKLRINSDTGEALANFEPGTVLCESLDRLVRNLESQVAMASLRTGQRAPTLSIS